MASLPEGYDQLLTPGEVARIFGVDTKTVNRWAKLGRLPSCKTPGGHHRFPEPQVRAMLAERVNAKSA